MKCDKHPESDAVGICKSCYRGLCSDCAVEAGSSLACDGACKDRVIQLDALVAQNLKASKSYKNIRKNGVAQALFLLCPGVAFVCVGLWEDSLFSLAVGSPFVAYACYVFYRTLTFPKLNEDQ